eukprot:2550-Heterococcus_DN1.PRE.1
MRMLCAALLASNTAAAMCSVIAVTASTAEALYECDVGDVRMQRDVRDVIVCTDQWRVTLHYTAGQPLYVDSSSIVYMHNALLYDDVSDD